jgi:hypothetical protein
MLKFNRKKSDSKFCSLKTVIEEQNVLSEEGREKYIKSLEIAPLINATHVTNKTVMEI